MKKGLLWGLIAVLLLAFTACAAGPNGLVDTEDEEGVVAGFWRGVWHGMIAPITFIITLFGGDLNIYEAHNTGNWYNFGFIIGLMGIAGGSGRGSKRSRRKRD